jgi:predicted nucleic acid-binding protein
MEIRDMMVVSNTGPLIALAKIDRLALQEQLFGQVLIPLAVHRELK